MFKSHFIGRVLGFNEKENLAPISNCHSPDSYWRSNWKRNTDSNWSSTRSNNGNSIFNFKKKEQPRDFFSANRSHSEEIGKVIFDGFGRNSDLWGHCIYENGNLDRIDPNVKSIRHIGLAKLHLQKGYANVWEKKENLEKEIENINNEIGKTVKQFEEFVISAIPNKFKAGENIVSETNPDFLPFYYQRHTFSFIFGQITNKFEGIAVHKIESYTNRTITLHLPTGVIKIETFCVFTLFRDLALGDKRELEEYVAIVESLIADQNLNKLVQKYRTLQTKLLELNIEGFYNDIDKIWNEIFENGNTLEGQKICNYCPKKLLFDLF